VAVVIVTIMVPIMAVMIVPAVAVVIPVVIVLEAVAAPIPIPYKILPTVMMRRNPTRAHIRRPRPGALVPPVVSSDGVPVTFDPDEIRARVRWKNANHAAGGPGLA